MKLSLSKLRPADPSWTAFLAFVFLTGISMPLARVALVLSLVFTLAQPERRKAFRINGPTLGWLIYLFLAFVISGLIAACASDVSTLLAQYASVKPRLIQWIPAWRMEMIRSALDSGTAASASGIWDCLPEFLATPFRRAGTDLFTEPLRGFSKLTKMLWYIAIPVAMAQVDSRSRLLTALRVLVLGCLVTALCVLFCNPLAAGYQMLFPTEYQVQAGTASPFSAFLYECTKALGKVEDVIIGTLCQCPCCIRGKPPHGIGQGLCFTPLRRRDAFREESGFMPAPYLIHRVAQDAHQRGREEKTQQHGCQQYSAHPQKRAAQLFHVLNHRPGGIIPGGDLQRLPGTEQCTQPPHQPLTTISAL